MTQAQDSQDKTTTRINIQLPPELEATYANLTLVSHSPSEVILDFARIMPNSPTSKIYSRIVMTPMNAKLLYQALGANLQKFEAKYGTIDIPANIILDPNRGFTS